MRILNESFSRISLSQVKDCLLYIVRFINDCVLYTSNQSKRMCIYLMVMIYWKLDIIFWPSNSASFLKLFFKKLYIHKMEVLSKYKVSKVGDPCRARPEGSLFNSYDTKV